MLFLIGHNSVDILHEPSEHLNNSFPQGKIGLHSVELVTHLPSAQGILCSDVLTLRHCLKSSCENYDLHALDVETHNPFVHLIGKSFGHLDILHCKSSAIQLPSAHFCG